jgi:hypothetical protein
MEADMIAGRCKPRPSAEDMPPLEALAYVLRGGEDRLSVRSIHRHLFTPSGSAKRLRRKWGELGLVDQRDRLTPVARAVLPPDALPDPDAPTRADRKRAIRKALPLGANMPLSQCLAAVLHNDGRGRKRASKAAMEMNVRVTRDEKHRIHAEWVAAGWITEDGTPTPEGLAVAAPYVRGLRMGDAA